MINIKMILQTKQAPARLNRRIQVGRALGKAREAECVGGIGFLRRDHPAAGPLVTPVLAAEHHVYHLAVPIQNGSPHLEPQAAVLLLQDSAELAAKGVVIALMRGLRPRKYPRDRGPQGALFGGAYWGGRPERRDKLGFSHPAWSRARANVFKATVPPARALA